MRDPQIITAATWLPLLRETLEREGHFRFPLQGNSMRPTLPSSCEIEIQPLQDTPRLGDLLVFVVGDTLVAHRFVRRRGNTWIAQGDNRLSPDRALRQEQVLGRVVFAYSGGRRVWPRRLSVLTRGLWIARYHGLRGARWLARRLYRSIPA
jgi:Peptidase S24-like